MRIYTCVLLFLFAQLAVGQAPSQNFWKVAKPHQLESAPGIKRPYVPSVFHSYQLDFQGLKAALASAPMEFTAAAKLQPLLLDLPVGDGRVEEFAVWQSSIMEDELAARWPDVRTFAGQGTRDKKLTIRFDHTLNGFHAQLMEAGGATFQIEPVTVAGSDFYRAFDIASMPPRDPNGPNPTVEKNDDLPKPEAILNQKGGISGEKELSSKWFEDTVTLYRYRLAVVSTTEYAESFGGTKAAAFSEVVTAVNALTMAYERDIAIRFVLPAKEDTLVFSTDNPDPFGPANDVGQLVGQPLAQVINPRIGQSAYDLGHVFTRYTGNSGILGLGGGNVCVNGSKTVGGSSDGFPSGVNFYSTCGQEIGHQFGGSHTFNCCTNVNGPTAYEPYSGSTIMSYVSWGPDLYFHNISIEEISLGAQLGTGNTCAVKTPTNNRVPTVEIPIADNFYIPFGTPFDLTAIGSDPDGDPVSYCWEQFDLGPATPDLAQATGTPPIFRTYLPTISPTRIFPKMEKILANSIPAGQGEVLPAYDRPMTFRCTVRDNVTGGGGVAFGELHFRTASTGPFRVTKPNSASEKWTVGDFIEVKWETANSENAPVNCKIVDIDLSTDGGLTWPISLADNVANDGSHFIKVPNNLTAKARLRIHAADNIFFDVSNNNYKIEAAAAPGWAMLVEPNSGQICLPATFWATIETAGWFGFSENINLEIASGLPPGATASFTQTAVSPGGNVSLNIDFQGVTLEGDWEVMLKGKIAGGDSLVRSLKFTTVSNDFSSLALVDLPDGTFGASILPTLKWAGAADANTYDFELATSPTFDAASIITQATGLTGLQATPASTLEYKTMYFWRVRPVNECAVHAWTEPFVFGTEVLNCQVAEAEDLPKNISASGTPTVESTVAAPFTATITDVNVSQLKGAHEFFKDLLVMLVSPAGTVDTLFSKKCGNTNSNFNFGMDDESPVPFGCPPNSGKDYQPKQPLSVFDGQSSNGDWKLVVKDLESGGGGALLNFALEFCGSVQLQPPFIINNIALQIDPGNHADVASLLLKVGDPNNTDPQLTYTLVVLPEHGHLMLKGASGPLTVGSKFTQEDINNGSLQYFDYGSPDTDKFTFVVADGEGGFIPKTVFFIEKTNVSIEEPTKFTPTQFALAPNPTADFTSLTFDKPTDSPAQIQVWNTDGRVVFSEKIGAGILSKSIPTEGLPGGIYLVSVRTESGLLSKKLVVSR